MMANLKKSRYMQYVSSFLSTLSLGCIGMYTSWSSPILPQLTSENSPIGVTLTHEEASWVASVLLLAIVPAGFIAALTVERFGRRKVLLMSGIPTFLAWIGVTYANSAWTLILARFVAGIGCGIPIAVAPMYIGEVAEKDIRGKLGSLINMLKLMGSFFTLCIGSYVSYKALSLTSSILPLLFLVLFYFMPETPYYLIQSGKKSEAQINLIKLSSKSADSKFINTRMAEIETTVENDMKNKSSLSELFSKQYRKSVIIMFGMKTLQQLSGMHAIDAYTQSIIKLTDSSISPEISNIICGFIQIPAATFLTDKMGRRPLLFISSLGCGIALIGEGLYFYLQDVAKTDVSHLAWLPTTALVLFLVMNPIGVFTLPFVLLGEMFATNIKGIAISVLTIYAGFLAFVVVKFFTPISQAWGMHTMFWIFAAICLLGCVFILAFLPETKGKTFAEIQDMLHKDENSTGSG